ncbi:stage VI sporulation protein D [Rossellomorea marisflavi]|uniref:stage VI sporulation protein D n=1 Tax=Rossellomorea marisflavi TaxID=189381 RepID=UPI0025B20CA8|nr:stage VI sporulation protein D [Rossellomorea marisflavi]WJV20160.1 stage VI sporulation protein D [Rossellomorea marisflavi]
MSQQSSLRFSLEESIWFKKGQEVEELLSISLDPHITIQEQEQYILIRGSLDLSGEYLPSSVRDDDEAYEVDEILEASGKYVQMVESREKGELEFIHCFPVDVTIPKNRIENLEDIDVYVEAFDYAVPENACIRLNADLTITGIFGEQQVQTPVEEELYEPMYRAVDTMEEVEAEEAADVTMETVVPDYIEEPPREEEYDVFSLSPVYDEVEDEEEQEETEPFVLEGRVTPEEEEIPVQIQYESFPEPEAMRSEKMFELPEHELSESSEAQSYQHYVQESVQPPVQLPVQEVMEAEEEEEEESSSSSEVEAAKKTKGKKKKYESISLTDFFARKEEERGATLRVCIVQDGDTLDSIAEKYELTIPQLLRVNQLEANQDVYGGQVLYIPPEEPAFR